MTLAMWQARGTFGARYTALTASSCLQHLDLDGYGFEGESVPYLLVHRMPQLTSLQLPQAYPRPKAATFNLVTSKCPALKSLRICPEDFQNVHALSVLTDLIQLTIKVDKAYPGHADTDAAQLLCLPTIQDLSITSTDDAQTSLLLGVLTQMTQLTRLFLNQRIAQEIAHCHGVYGLFLLLESKAEHGSPPDVHIQLLDIEKRLAEWRSTTPQSLRPRY